MTSVPEDRRPWDRPFRILHLFRRHGRRLEADEGPQGQCRRGGDAAPHAVARTQPVRRERREVIGVHEEQTDDADEREGDELQHRGNQLNDARLAHAGDVDQREQPHETDRHGRHGHVAVGQRRPEHRQVAGERDRDGRVARPGGDPVAPRRLEPDEVTECPMRVGVRSTGLRIRAPEGGEDRREEHGADPRQCPRQQRSGSGRERDRRERGGEQEDARTDHVADDQRRRRRKPELALERGFGSGSEFRCPFHGTLLPLEESEAPPRPLPQ